MLPIIVLLVGPFIAGLLSLVIGCSRLLHVVNFSTMLALVGADTALTTRILSHGPIIALGDLVYIDALSAFILLIITTIGLSCSLYMWSYMDEQVARGIIAPKRLSVFFFLFHMFLLAMVAATIANSLGVQWVTLEGTTLATTFLIAFVRRRESLEAGWKYLILCSVGIALALFGIVLTYYSSVRVLGDVSAALNITSLIGVGYRLDSRAQIGLHFYLCRLRHEGRISPDAYMVTGSLQRGTGSSRRHVGGRAGNGRGVCDRAQQDSRGPGASSGVQR